MIDTYVALDLETTGLDAKHDKIIEIGAVNVRKGIITERFSVLVNPGQELVQTVIDLTGITNEDLKSAPHISEVIQSLLDFIGDDNLLGHSILFDYSFVKRAAVNAGKQFENQGIDTLRIARKYLPELESRSLSALCTYYEIEHHAHRALEDAVATHELFKKLCENFYVDTQEKDFNPVRLIYKVKKEGPITKHQKEQLNRLAQEKNLTFTLDMDCLTKNEASRITDMILNGTLHGIISHPNPVK